MSADAFSTMASFMAFWPHSKAINLAHDCGLGPGRSMEATENPLTAVITRCPNYSLIAH